MPNEKQDLMNHRQTALACKNYTDKEVKKAKDELITFFSRNTVDTDDHTNELAYQITAPAGAKLLQLQAIGGNTVKLSPSVASDSTKAMIKTMPSTVYTFNGDKLYGDSEVSENLLAIVDGSVSRNNVIFTFLNGICNSSRTPNNTGWAKVKEITLPAGTYYFKDFGTGSSKFNMINASNQQLSNPFTLSETSTIYLAITGNTIINTGQLVNSMPMLIKGSTTPTVWKQGYTGIHNIELSGLKVEGENLFSCSSFNNNYAEYNADTCYFKLKQNNIHNLPNTITLEAGTYTIYRSTNRNQLYLYDSNNNIIMALNETTSETKTFTETKTISKYASWNGDWEGYIAIVRGSSVPTTYAPYETPTTKTIDLSTILYNGSPLFEGNSLKGVNDVKDILTPYKATKKLGYVDLGSLNWNYDSSSNLPRFNSVDRLTNFVATYNNPNVVLLCPIYTLSSTIWLTSSVDLTIGIYTNGSIYLRNTAYTDATAFKTAMSGVYLVYELATPIEVNIDWSATLRNIQGYPNGSIIAENTHNMDVESVITYNSIIQETLCPSVTITRNGVDILTRNLPTQASDGWSAETQRNYRVFCDDEGNAVNKRYGNVNKRDLGDLTYTYNSNVEIFSSTSLIDYKKPTNNNTALNGIAKDYTITNWNDLVANNTNMNIAVLSTDNQFIARNTYIDNANDFKTAMSGVPLYYELADASKTETDMDDFDYFFDVEEGDVITLNNPYAQQVYATYSFLIKEAKSNE